MSNKNSNLHQAKKQKNDEFYTQLIDNNRLCNDYVVVYDKKTKSYKQKERLLTMNHNGEEIEYFNIYYGNEDKFDRFYERPDIINVNKVKDIPIDYEGLIAVPITYFNKHDDNVFQIVGLLGHSDDGSGYFLGKTYLLNPDGSKGKELYKRFVIKRRNPSGYYFMLQSLFGDDI